VLIFWVYRLCNSDSINQHFGETYCFQLKGKSENLHSIAPPIEVSYMRFDVFTAVKMETVCSTEMLINTFSIM
jgi:hypothetical protein